MGRKVDVREPLSMISILLLRQARVDEVDKVAEAVLVEVVAGVVLVERGRGHRGWRACVGPSPSRRKISR